MNSTDLIDRRVKRAENGLSLIVDMLHNNIMPRDFADFVRSDRHRNSALWLALAAECEKLNTQNTVEGQLEIIKTMAVFMASDLRRLMIEQLQTSIRNQEGGDDGQG